MPDIRAHMAGVVIEIKVKVGDNIAKGQEIAVLEAMKMQMPIASDAAGKVQNLRVNPGDFVNEGDSIISLS